MSGWALLGSAAIGAWASNRAAKEGAKGADRAGQIELQMFNQIREDQAPYREVGGQALNAYAQALGLPGYSAPTDTVGGVRGTSGLAVIPGATWQGRPVFADESGGIYSGRGRDWTAGQGVEYLGHASDSRRGGLRFKGGNTNRFVKMDGGGLLDYRDGDFYTHRGPRAEMINLEFSEAAAAPPAPTDRYGGFKESPGYQFRMAEGQKGINRHMAARGLLNSGARGKAMSRFNQDYASNEFNNYLNQLANAAGLGQTATQATGQAGMSAGRGMASSRMAEGNARASGYMGMGNTANNAINNWLMYRALS